MDVCQRISRVVYGRLVQTIKILHICSVLFTPKVNLLLISLENFFAYGLKWVKNK